MYRFFISIILIAVNTFIISGCTERQVIFDEMRGKVIDAETKQPVEGAVIFVSWQLEGKTIINNYASDIIYASEVKADKDGHFIFPETKQIQLPKSGVNFLERTPFVSASMYGYGITGVSLYNKKQRKNITTSVYSKYKEGIYIIKIKKAQPTEVVLDNINSDTGAILQIIEHMLKNNKCTIQKIPMTIKYFDNILNNVQNDRSNNELTIRLSLIQSKLQRCKTTYCRMHKIGFYNV